MCRDSWRALSSSLLIGAALLMSPGRDPNPSPPSAGDGAAARPRAALRFEANDGQWDPRTAFVARAHGYGLYLTSDGATLALSSHRGAARSASRAVLRMRVVGGRATQPIGLEETAGHSNYFIGDDPSRWRTGVKAYARVRYPEVKPGLDLVLYGTDERALEYDLILAPGVEPTELALAFDGADDLHVGDEGDLRMAVGAERIRQRRPTGYQPRTDGGRAPVAVDYRRNRDGTIGFAVGPYDRTRPLVIDPVLVYATFLGGSGTDEALAVAIDAAGNAYVTGDTESVDFPATPGAFRTATTGAGDVFVSKLNPAGTALVYSTFFGGSALDAGNGIAVDAAGNAYVAVSTESTDYPTTPGAYQTSGGNGGITKLDPTGAVVYSTLFGGGCGGTPAGIAVDSGGNAYVAGPTCTFGFPTTPGAFQTTAEEFGRTKGFALKLNAAGSGVVYATYLGGDRTDQPNAVALDGAGHLFVTGLTLSDDFPTTPGSYQPSSGLRPDVGTSFVTKLSADGSGLEYSTFFGGAASQTSAIAVDAAGNAYVTGSAQPAFPTTPGAFQPTDKLPSTNCCTGFVAKLNASGSALAYASFLGGSGGEQPQGIGVDAAGNAYVTGASFSSDFPTTPDALQPTRLGSYPAFLAKVSASGGALLYATYLGGVGSTLNGATASINWGLAVAPSGTAYMVGSSRDGAYPTTPGVIGPSLNGAGDAIVTKLATVTPSAAVPATAPGWRAALGMLLAGAGLLSARRERRARG
jgi:hypothetical protein